MGEMNPPALLNGHAPNDAGSSNATTISGSENTYDLICVGFGPASLAIAIALHDRELPNRPRVLYLEQQPQFSWHAGMLLPGSRMQISFIKDLASLRDPRSHFTFLNYLHKKGRLIQFINLGTFLPLREEYNDYLAWCAQHFEDQVKYGEKVTGVYPVQPGQANGKTPVRLFDVHSKTAKGEAHTRTTRHVVVAVGGKPNIPKMLQGGDERIIHSSQYAYAAPRLLNDAEAKYNIAVIGGGQSAAEIFADLNARYKNCRTRMIIRGQALRPSDDSPFVNEIFNPEKVSELYSLPANVRTASITSDKATNYGVVRLDLLEHLYEHLYAQRLRDPDEANWPHNIITLTELTSVRFDDPINRITLRMRNVRTGVEAEDAFDAVIIATGYMRDAHKEILAGTEKMLRADEKTGRPCWGVGRDYRVRYAAGQVAEDAGVWLQGCCEDTHGLSDTLLSILAIRGAEMVDSIFGKETEARQDQNGRVPLPLPSSPPQANGHAMVDGTPKGETAPNGTTTANDTTSNGLATTQEKGSTALISITKNEVSAWKNLGSRLRGRNQVKIGGPSGT